MPRYFPDDLLRRLRNDISWASLLSQLEWPHKMREGQLAFLCPRCREYNSATFLSTRKCARLPNGRVWQTISPGSK